MDIWAFCADCQRWFYSSDWLDRTAPPPTCPVCASQPIAIENRAEPVDSSEVVDLDESPSKVNGEAAS